MLLAIKMALSKVWAWLLVAVTTTLGAAVLFFRWSAARAQRKAEAATEKAEQARQQAAGYEAVLRQREHAEKAAAAIDRKYAEKASPDVAKRDDFSKPDF